MNIDYLMLTGVIGITMMEVIVLVNGAMVSSYQLESALMSLPIG